MMFTHWTVLVFAEGIERGYGWEVADGGVIGGTVVFVEVFEPGVAGVSGFGCREGKGGEGLWVGLTKRERCELVRSCGMLGLR